MTLFYPEFSVLNYLKEFQIFLKKEKGNGMKILFHFYFKLFIKKKDDYT